MVAYDIWDSIASDPKVTDAAGVKMKPSHFFFPCPIEDDPMRRSGVKGIRSVGVRGFVRDWGILRSTDVNPAYGAVDAYKHLAPIIDTD